jgi:hypothetical protein
MEAVPSNKEQQQQLLCYFLSLPLVVLRLLIRLLLLWLSIIGISLTNASSLAFSRCFFARLQIPSDVPLS